LVATSNLLAQGGRSIVAGESTETKYGYAIYF